VVVAFGTAMSSFRGHVHGLVNGVRWELRERGVEVHDINVDFTRHDVSVYSRARSKVAATSFDIQER
jgi:hypothetical protein